MEKQVLAPQTIIATCKKHYREKIKEQAVKAMILNQQEAERMKQTVAAATASIFKEKNENNNNNPYLYISPKMHKPTEAWRPIVGSSHDGNYMTQISKILSRLLRTCIWALRSEDEIYFTQEGFRIFFAEDNLDIAMRDFRKYNKEIKNNAQYVQPNKLISTDFATMYVSAQKEAVINNVTEAVHNAFNFTATQLNPPYDSDNTLIIRIENNELPSWLYTDEIRDMDFSVEKITTLINIVVQNAIFTSNNTYHAQNGLAIGGDSSSELANLYLANIERRTILQHARSGTNMQCGSPAWFISPASHTITTGVRTAILHKRSTRRSTVVGILSKSRKK